MDLQQALDLFGLPFAVSQVKETGISTVYRIDPQGKTATLSRLNSRLDDIQAATGLKLSVVLENGVWIRSEKENKTVYNYRNYGGYVDEKYGVYEIPFMVGMTATECIVADLAAAPHLLVAGTTGSGKSNYLHTLIDALLCNKDCSVQLVDCKRVEFSVYEKCCNVFLDIDGAYFVTAWYIQEINERYKRMQAAGYSDFKEYRKTHPDEKYRVLVIDELADLLMNKNDRKELSPRLQKIAQVGRAAGCHMVLATQRPDCETIDGVLKANIPSRIAFNVSSKIDSQIIIDRTGAERLTGNGDGLYLDKKSNLTRFQSCYLPLDEIKSALKKNELL